MIWNKRRSLLALGMSLLSTCLNQYWFPPGTESPFVHTWRSAGTTRLLDITSNKYILDSMLQKPTLWFQYLQLQHLRTTLPKTLSFFHILLMHEVFLKTLMASDRNLLSEIYIILLISDTVWPKSYFKN